MTNISRTRPWNRADQTVYSIASFSNGRHNMNICTYVTPVALKPKRYMVAIYKGTFTEQLVKEEKEFILQFLSVRQASFVPLLGRMSGFDRDKTKDISNPQSYNQFLLLPGITAFVHLKVIGWFDGGDHDCAFCDVVRSKNLSDDKLLTTSFLRQKKIIRA